MEPIIAVHCGAGTYNSKHYRKYKFVAKKACLKGDEILKNGGTALMAVKAAITVLENDPLTNCGFGSNLTIDGEVENDASIMDGKTLIHGACGAVKNVKNPIDLAYDICLKQSEVMPLGLVPPSLLVGKGATQYAKNVGLRTVRNKSLIGKRALKQHARYKKMLDVETSHVLKLDTVGAVCVDATGHVAAGCSSGGILLKKPGRVGQAAIYGCGTWADSFDENSETAIAVCTSGCGEHLVRTQLAKEISDVLMTSSCPTLGLNTAIQEKFIHCRYLANVQQKLCGALVLHVNKSTGDVAVIWGHSTESMGIGYFNSSKGGLKAVISELPKDVTEGNKVNVSGVYFYNMFANKLIK